MMSWRGHASELQDIPAITVSPENLPPFAYQTTVQLTAPLTGHFGPYVPIFPAMLLKKNINSGANLSVSLIKQDVPNEDLVLELSTSMHLAPLTEFENYETVTGLYAHDRMTEFVSHVDTLYGSGQREAWSPPRITFTWDTRSGGYKPRQVHMDLNIDWSGTAQSQAIPVRCRVTFCSILRPRTAGDPSQPGQVTPFDACYMCPPEVPPHRPSPGCNDVEGTAQLQLQLMPSGAFPPPSWPSFSPSVPVPNPYGSHEAAAAASSSNIQPQLSPSLPLLLPAEMVGSQLRSHLPGQSQSGPLKGFVPILPRPARDSQTSGNRLAGANDVPPARSPGMWHNAVPTDFELPSASASRRHNRGPRSAARDPNSGGSDSGEPRPSAKKKGKERADDRLEEP